MAAFLIPAAIQGVSSIIGGITGNRAAKKAARQINEAANRQATQTGQTGQKVVNRMEEQYNKGVGEYQPYADVGEQGLRSLADFLGLGGGTGKGAEEIPFNVQGFKFDPNSAAVDPSMKFRLDAAQRQIERSAAAKGNIFAGGTAEALARRSQEIASEEYQNMFNRAQTEYQTGVNAALENFNAANINRQNIYNRLMGITGMGEGAAANIASLGTNFANAAGGIDMATQEAINQLLMTGAGAQASGTIGGNNAWQNALSGVSGAAQNFMMAQRLSKLLGMQGGGGTGTLAPFAPNAPAGVPSDLFSGVPAFNPGQFAAPTLLPSLPESLSAGIPTLRP